MTCMEVRERLTEHAVGVLSKPDAREVERHLEWCAGCRKEASELFEGAASMAFALPVAAPPSSLEGRIVERFRMSTGKAPAPPRGRLWVLAAATLTAALLAAGSLGWAVAQRSEVQTREQLLIEARKHNKDLVSLLNAFQGSGRTFTAILTAPPGAQGFGQAILFSAPKDGFVLVDIPVLPASSGPFVLQLVGSGVIDAGQLNGDGRVVALRWFTEDNLGSDIRNLGRVKTVSVIDQSTGAVVLSGSVQPYSS